MFVVVLRDRCCAWILYAGWNFCVIRVFFVFFVILSQTHTNPCRSEFGLFQLRWNFFYGCFVFANTRERHFVPASSKYVRIHTTNERTKQALIATAVSTDRNNISAAFAAKCVHLVVYVRRDQKQTQASRRDPFVEPAGDCVACVHVCVRLRRDLIYSCIMWRVRVVFLEHCGGTLGIIKDASLHFVQSIADPCPLHII